MRLKFHERTPEQMLDVLVPLFEIDSSGCWLWTGSIRDTGYGQYNNKRAHRLIYELSVGPIPEGLALDHLCSVRRCVNPDHLEPVTVGENSRRGAKPRPVCLNGHRRTPENTYITPGGTQQCKECRRIWWRNNMSPQGKSA